MRKMVLYLLVAAVVLVFSGCSKKADENKPISQVQTEAEKMSAGELKATVLKYKDAIAAKKPEVEKMMAKLKDIPVDKLLGEEAATLKADAEKLNKSIAALKERMDIYYNKLKEKGGDLSGLSIE